MNDRQRNSAVELLEGAAAELAQIHRGKHYALWRQDAAPRLGDALAQFEPFSDFCNVWLHTGDGNVVSARPTFGEWAIDLLVAKKTPEAILAAFAAEVERNVANYCDVSLVFGVQIDEPCSLRDGVTLVPDPEDVLASLLHHSPFRPIRLPTGTSLLCQPSRVTPAFKRGIRDQVTKGGRSVTALEADHRDAMRKRVRLACLLAGAGPVELPLTVVRPDQGALFVSAQGNLAARSFTAHPLVSCPVEAVAVKSAFELLGGFREVESLTRAIDRLGRARLADSPVDRALELGIAAEIALMHDHSSGTEITHKIGSRAAWLLGHDPTEREAIFDDMKKLYQARSQAVHLGALSSKSTVDLDAADRLVAGVLSAILERGGFPNWNT